jgi:hypothetical protein
LNTLTEYTFADTVTNVWPYKQNIGQVGYNISSVDSTYGPVAMAPIRPSLPPIPYIGTVMSLTTFRAYGNCNPRDTTVPSGDSAPYVRWAQL